MRPITTLALAGLLGACQPVPAPGGQATYPVAPTPTCAGCAPAYPAWGTPPQWHYTYTPPHSASATPSPSPTHGGPPQVSHSSQMRKLALPALTEEETMLVLKIMNTARYHLGTSARTMEHIAQFRAKLEGYVGVVTEEVR